METYNQNDMHEAGLDMVFVQDNQSMSTKDVLRELHFQKQFYIPEGFAHSFLVLSETSEFCCKVTDFYRPDDEGGFAWNDLAISIEWPELTGSHQETAFAEGVP